MLSVDVNHCKPRPVQKVRGGQFIFHSPSLKGCDVTAQGAALGLRAATTPFFFIHPA